MAKRTPVLAADVTRVLDRWRPTGWSDDDLQALEPLMGTVSGWVAAAGPKNPERARWFLRCTAGLAVWASRSLGTSDVRTVLHPTNVDYWSMKVNSHRTMGWRENTRWVLQAVGRAANPAAWPSPSLQVGRRDIAAPYTATEELAYLRAAKLPGRRNRTERLWIVAGALGGGLNGKEIAVARIEDVLEVGSERLAVRVRGNNSRLTPVRHEYTDMAWRTLNGAGEGRFIQAGGRNLVYNICARLDSGNGQGLVLRRARSTWILAHLTAGTSFAALRRVAGSLSANTLDGLLGHIADPLDDTEAVREALRA